MHNPEDEAPRKPGVSERSEATPDFGSPASLAVTAVDVPSGAEPTNQSTRKLHALRYGVDSLYLSIPGQLSDEGAVRLDRSREDARSEDESRQALAQVSLLDHLFEAAPTGGKLFKYRLSDHAYRIQIKSQKAKRMPLAYAQIGSRFITAVGVEQAVSQLRSILSSFGSLDPAANVSRVDLFVDFVCPFALDSWDDDAWVTRADYIGRHRVAGDFTGWSIGRGKVTARLYDKTLEIKTSGKDYLLPIWIENGWDGVSPVYRLEFQFRNEALKELGCNQYPEVLQHLGGLWEYAATKWLRLCVPSASDDTKTRWPLHPLWEGLQRVPWANPQPLTRVPIRLGGVPTDEALFRPFFSALTSYMAARGVLDPDEAWERLFLEARSHYEALDVFKEEGFYGQAKTRASRKAIAYGVPFPHTTETAQQLQDKAVADAYRKQSGR